MAAAFEPEILSITSAGARTWMGTGPPTVAGDSPDTNGFRAGDTVINSAPGAGVATAWVCVKAGSPGVWLAQGGTGGVVTVSLTSAQILKLNSAPVTLVAAPGAGIILVPEWLALTMTTTSTQYTGTGVMEMVYHGATTALTATIAAAVINATAGTSYSLVQASAITTTMLANTALDLYVTGADPGAGTGTAKVTLKYIAIQA